MPNGIYRDVEVDNFLPMNRFFCKVTDGAVRLLYECICIELLYVYFVNHCRVIIDNIFE